MRDIQELGKQAKKEIEHVSTSEELEDVRIAYLGRKGGKVNEVLKSLKDLSIEEKRRIGPQAQELKSELEELIAQKSAELEVGSKERIDLTKPAVNPRRGHLHPLTQASNRAREIFNSMNFSIVEGDEVETEHYNFDALNIPENHPAREMFDTFWLPEHLRPSTKLRAGKEKSNRLLLRTHTSPMQVRFMEQHEPPFRIVVPGRVFRYEATDASHEVNFYQLEGLMVGKGVSLANFKYIITRFLRAFFEDDSIEVRFRPSYFPFVEPGVEVDMKFGDEWLELMGAGMVHPHVFEAAHYNPDDWQGFAFGVGLDRLAMIKYNIPDIRLFYSRDVRFLRQF